MKRWDNHLKQNQMKNHSAYRRLREAKGFTLMEILVVMVIIVVLATLTISI